MNSVIQIEGLSKRYTLQHQGGSGLLRDRLANLMRNPFRARKTARAAAEEFWALRDVNFTINQGDVVGIIGRNGAGKSTLLKILSRITEPTTGRITIEGRVASLLEVGTGFHGELSGRENIFLNGAILGMKRTEIRKKFDEIVAFSEVEKFLDTPVKHYSSGMYVRLAFAVAAHLEPEILIIDEVLAVGDQEFQKKCLGKIERVSRGEGRTVLFVSHNLATVGRLCTSALLLNSGRVAAQGAVTETIAQYLQDTDDMGPRISTARRLENSGMARILGGSLVRAGQPSNVFGYGDSVCFGLELEVTAAVRANIEVTLRDSQQAPIGLLPAAVINGSHHELQPGRHNLLVELRNLRLASGTYSLDVALTEHLRQCYDRLGNAFSFEVLPNALGPDKWNFAHSYGQGSFLLDGSCTVCPESR
jgi:lipopolysaccharide transport system ATP-binding protein